MRSHVVVTMMMSTAFGALPVVGSADPPGMMHSCAQAFMSQLTAGAARPIKVVEGREVDRVGPASEPSGATEYELTARDAASDRTIARAVCTFEHGRLVLQNDPLAVPLGQEMSY